MLPELPKPIAANISLFTGRAWLLPKLLAWLEGSDQRIFLITGGPGTGKSMVIAWLSGCGPDAVDPAAAGQLLQIRSQIVAAHFCQAASRNLSPRAAAENLANQLTQKIPRFGDALAATLAERVQIAVTQQVGTQAGGTLTGVSIGRIDLGALSDEASFDRALTLPLQKLYQDGYDQPMILLFDGLDEAQTYTGSIPLGQLLSRLADLPPQVRILAATRPDPRVLKYFRDIPGCDLIADAPADEDEKEVCAYIARRLASEAPGLEAGQGELLASRIAVEAQGVFLYAQMVLDDLLGRLAAIPDLGSYPLPHGLSKLYCEFLNRELGQEGPWYEWHQKLLGLIAVGRGPGLSRAQLASILGPGVDQPLRACRQYLAGDLPEGPFRIFDRSFTDFLLADGDNPDYHIDARAMHRLIASYYVRAFSQNWAGCDSYGLTYLVDHVLASGMEEQDRKATLERILTDTFVDAVHQCTGWLFPYMESLEALARVEPDWAARLCSTLILDRPPNSLVIQRSLQLLARLRPTTGPLGEPGASREAGLDKVVQILSDQAADVPGRLIESLEQETDGRLRGAIALALAETRDPGTAPRLLEMFKTQRGEASWAAADALIALNDRAVIPALIGWFRELQQKNDPTSRARKGRILYVLGRMHAEEAQELKIAARTAADAKILGRALDLTCLLQPDEKDRDYLRAQLAHILASSPQNPQELGPWKDEWLQKRLVRALVKLRVADTIPNLRRLLEHIRGRPSPKAIKGGSPWWETEAAKRRRLIEAVEEGITALQVGR